MDVEPHVNKVSSPVWYYKTVIMSGARYRIHDVISQPRRGPTILQSPHVTHVARHDG